MPFDIQSTVEAIAWMLLGASIIGMLARWIRLPYMVALVLTGVLIEESQFVALPHLEPRVLLFVFLPPLLFDAAFRLDDRELRAVLRPVLILALPGTVATALIAGLLLWGAGQAPLVLALLFGTIVAATDPVAVVPVFRALNAPARLSVIAEAESLINDGIAITLYTALVAFAVAGTADLLGSVALFAREVIGGVLIGGGMGILFSRVTGAIDDHLIEMTLSTALAYGSYLIAQSLDTSGALACVAAGLIHGSYGRQAGMSERTRQVLDDLWEYFGFLANALVFLLVGFSASLRDLLAAGWPVAVAIVAVVLARVVVVGLPGLLIPARTLATTGAERAVLVWGGLRGALTITLALALPPDLPGRQLVIAMAFGVVLFTLLFQGMTLPIVVQRVGLAQPA
ncbi:MAG TPA: sodium:proton antiporter [Chloroflexota bacterium]|jgi:CPA1 family monovalent cation:H+ antiporter|nr:sodium:proton antiporter [Chloroflexota bacterium]